MKKRTNFTLTNNSIAFKVNGGDKSTGYIMIGMVVAVMIIIIAFSMIIISQEGNPVLVISILVLGIIIDIVLLRLGFSGIFARYLITINKDHIIAFDKKTRTTLYNEKFEPSLLYISETRIQVGYVSTKRKALAYGQPKQFHVEDLKPSLHLTVLCFGDEKSIEELKDKILNLG